MSQQTPMVTSPEEPTAVLPGEGCRHHWMIQPAAGPVSEGVCLLCEEVREFKNYVEASTWADEKPTFRSYAGDPAVAARALADYLERTGMDSE